MDLDIIFLLIQVTFYVDEQRCHLRLVLSVSNLGLSPTAKTTQESISLLSREPTSQSNLSTLNPNSTSSFAPSANTSKKTSWEAGESTTEIWELLPSKSTLISLSLPSIPISILLRSYLTREKRDCITIEFDLVFVLIRSCTRCC